MESLSELVKNAKSITSSEMLYLIEETELILDREKRQGKQGDLIIKSGLVYLPAPCNLVVIGDIHGDIASLTWILENSSITEDLANGQKKILLLGDYGDRGGNSPDVYALLLRLKTMFPDSVILLRGNHEGPQDLQVVPYDLPHQLKDKFSNQSNRICEEMQELFQDIPHAAILPKRLLLLHGGVPSLATSLKDIEQANLTHPSATHLEEILWNDPVEDMRGTTVSPRGAGRLFGEDVTHKILGLANVKVLVRSHEPCHNGVAVSHKGMVLTLFSRKGPPYNNAHAAYLRIVSAEASTSAYELSASAQFF